jgi:uncharacterized protein with NAD-binding domain and iron-sulfur cluster
VKKIAVLGGGLGAMTAVYGLTRKPGWQQEYEITVYQMGWRLGGKGASGRNRKAGQRIEEHGLHIWMGFYENAFRVMRDCYGALGRTDGQPLRTVEEAFAPHTLSQLWEFAGGRWVPWTIDMPINGGVPGEGGPLPTPWQYVQMLLEWLLEGMVGPLHEEALEKILGNLAHDPASAALASGEPALRYVSTNASSVACPPENPHRCRLMAWLVEHLHTAHTAAGAMPADPAAHTPEAHASILSGLEGFLGRLRERVEDRMLENDGVRRLVTLADLGAAVVRGILADGILEKGFTAADDSEFRDWLARHGATPLALSCAPVREIYDLCFAYEDGDLARPNIAAGTAVEIAMRIAFTYKGAVMYKMGAGMGDTVFGPFFQVFERAGVRFEFFHQVRGLELSADKSSIAAIHVDRQVHLADGLAKYAPLCDVKGLPCWPSEPDYSQIQEGDALREGHVNLESRWNGWKPVEQRVLRAGVDFDEVVLGISLAALPEICGPLIAADGKWRDLVAHVGTVQTQAVQLWLTPTLAELGRPEAGVVAGTYAEPLDTWADMSELLPREDWPENGPRTILYLCGPKPGGLAPPASETSYPAAELDRTRVTARTWLESCAATILPRAGSSSNPAGLDWKLLHGADHSAGADALDTQYLRSNVDPTERYVLSLAGSTRYRLDAGKSGFSNLYLAGDWVRTGLNAGCVEAAVMAGMAASRAMCGYPLEIVGWNPDED